MNIIPATSAPRKPRTPTVTTTANQTSPTRRPKSAIPTAPCWMPTSAPPSPPMADPTAKMRDACALHVDPDRSRPPPGCRAPLPQMRPNRPRLAHDSSAATTAKTTTPSRIALCVAAQAEHLELRVDHALQRDDGLHVEDELLAEERERQRDEGEPDLVQAGAHEADDDPADHRRGDADEDGEGQRHVGLGGQSPGDERAGRGEAGLAEAQDAALPGRHREAEEDHGEGQPRRRTPRSSSRRRRTSPPPSSATAMTAVMMRRTATPPGAVGLLEWIERQAHGVGRRILTGAGERASDEQEDHEEDERQRRDEPVADDAPDRRVAGDQRGGHAEPEPGQRRDDERPEPSDERHAQGGDRQGGVLRGLEEDHRAEEQAGDAGHGRGDDPGERAEPGRC